MTLVPDEIGKAAMTECEHHAEQLGYWRQRASDAEQALFDIQKIYGKHLERASAGDREPMRVGNGSLCACGHQMNHHHRDGNCLHGYCSCADFQVAR